MREYFRRVLISWPTWTGSLMEVAGAIYAAGMVLGLWTVPVEVWEQIITAVTVILAGLYKLFTIGNNPMDGENY